jgi:hypothetical protein
MIGSTLIPILLSLLFLQTRAFTVGPISLQYKSLGIRQPHHHTSIIHSSQLYLSQNETPDPTTEKIQYSNFREAEIAGLRCMQQSLYSQAVSIFQQALQLPGSKVDVIRSKLTPGPSPVGGAFLGGTEGKVVYTLDEFEYQAVYYNLACAYSQLNQVDEVSCKNHDPSFLMPCPLYMNFHFSSSPSSYFKLGLGEFGKGFSIWI